MKTGAFLPDDVRRFVLTSIPSVPYLEAMLLIRDAPDTAWDAAALARRLYMTDKAAAALLVELHEAGILEGHALDADTPQYRYAPSSAELRDMIDQLATCYSKNLVEVTNLIHSTTSKRAQQFADAFKWRKDS